MMQEIRRGTRRGSSMYSYERLCQGCSPKANTILAAFTPCSYPHSKSTPWHRMPVKIRLRAATYASNSSVQWARRVAATADYVDMQNCEAQIKVWMYNEMSRRSFGRFAERWYFRWLPMASQYMWWNWSLKIKFNGKGEYYDLQTSDAAW